MRTSRRWLTVTVIAFSVFAVGLACSTNLSGRTTDPGTTGAQDPSDKTDPAADGRKGFSAAENTSQKPILAWHFVLNSVPMEQAYQMADVAHSAGFNTVVIQIARGLQFESSRWAVSKNAWSKEEFKRFITYVRARDMQVVPEVKLLSQQKKLFRSAFPDLMFNAATYDPRNEKVYAKIFPLLNELIELVDPPAIHIGHDEVAGFRPYSARKYLGPGEKMLPADLFLKDVIALHEYLESRNVETWMWGDMLISEEEFPTMSRKNLHGSMPGYGKQLRDKLPRDITICDWHYDSDVDDFQSLSTMVGEGFRVIGATFREPRTTRNFSRYASRHGASGMMATTWFLVQRREWEQVYSILELSGETFRGDFL